MSLDIAPPAPVSPIPASGGPPGAGPPTPDSLAQAFAALLAQQASPPTGRTPAKGLKSADETWDDPSRTDKKGDKDATNDPASPGLTLVSGESVPPETIIPAAALVLPAPAVPLDAPTAATALASRENAAEVMDTSPASTPALSGSAQPLSGGELLPQPTQQVLPVAEHAPTGFALPQAMPVSPADDPAQAASQPASAAMPPTKIALQGYAQFAQTALQNASDPANNTGRGEPGPALQGKQEGGKSLSSLGSNQGETMPSAPVVPAGPAALELVVTDDTQADTKKDKFAGSGKEAAPELLLPTTSQQAETKAATVSSAPLPASDREALMQQASNGMQALHAQALKSGHGQMTLQLHPQDWGKLQVSVTMTPSGGAAGGTNVTAHLVADSASVKQALEANSTDLRRTLREAGLHLESLTVTVRPAAASSEAQSMGGRPGGDGKQSAFQNEQWKGHPGSRGESAAGTPAGNGGTAFGGGNTQSHTRQRPAAQVSTPAQAHEQEQQASRATLTPSRAGGLDTRA